MKGSVEKILGRKVTDTDFNRALEDAKRKQDFLMGLGYKYVTGGDYLLELVCEYIRQNAFSDFTMEVCRTLNMEKEHSFRRTERPMDTPIVAVSAE